MAGRKSLGTRVEHKTRVPAAIDVEQLAKQRGCSNVSQYLADLVCMDAGRPELTRELSQEMMPISA